MNQKYVFVSRHEPSESQMEMASDQGIDMEWVGDRDAFTWSPEKEFDNTDVVGVICVHPAISAKALIGGYDVAVFENGSRGEGFKCKGLHFYYAR